jgi:phosphatidate cytidylyltransferase
MESPDFLNPFQSPLFNPLLGRLLLVYAIAGLLITAVTWGKSWKEIQQSNLFQRYIGWLLLTPLYLVGVFSGRIPGLVIAALFIIGAVLEYGKIAGLQWSYRIWMALLAIWSVITASYFTEYYYALPLVYFLVFTGLAIRQNDAKASFSSAANAIYGSIWLIFSLGHIILLAHLNNSLDDTHILLFLVLFAVACADIGGYIFGKLFHKLRILDNYKVAEELSPNKTYIGTLGYIIGAGFAIWLLYFGLEQYLSPWLWAVVAVIIGVFSFVGGLTHSYFKRHFGVKDSGQLIPGHGGVIDRVDSIARVVVILYYFLLLAI